MLTSTAWQAMLLLMLVREGALRGFHCWPNVNSLCAAAAPIFNLRVISRCEDATGSTGAVCAVDEWCARCGAGVLWKVEAVECC